MRNPSATTGVEPLAWLTDVLERVVSGRTKAHELERLLPWSWKTEQLAAAVDARTSSRSDDACDEQRSSALATPLQTGQKAGMLAGELCLASDPELGADHLRAQAILARFNASRADEDALRLKLPTEPFGHFGEGAVVKPTLQCDHGYSIQVGARTFIDHDSVLLDCNRITIGEEVQIAPSVHICTATHPIDAATRRSGLEYALPVAVGDGVRLGGAVIVCPGVTIGGNTVVGAGGVVTRSLPATVVAAGNPCQVIRPVESQLGGT
jgi:maltose O-acetyltransferase